VINTFNKGDLLIDLQAGEVGLLMHRYDIIKRPQNPVWAWEILWCGYKLADIFRIQAFTESGMTNMVISGRMEHCKANDNLGVLITCQKY